MEFANKNRTCNLVLGYQNPDTCAFFANYISKVVLQMLKTIF